MKETKTQNSIDIPVAILAGGLATRMRPVSFSTPKSLIPVLGKPFLAYQLELLRTQGVRRIVLCVGHLGKQIEEYFGDGTAFGVKLEYSFDGPKLLGTGGALVQALPKLGDEFFVLYGDSYLPVELAPILESFKKSNKKGLMTVYHNKGMHDTSNIVFRSDRIVLYDKVAKPKEMEHIDYGLSIFKREVFEALDPNVLIDLADIMKRLADEGELAGFEIKERFYEVGSPQGLVELENYLSQRKP